ncbi:hypothetical protein H0H81_004517 [Sphagnurus paluster]|uniref:Ubiquitin-like protease family profile domain-containing protein n=1 Tax=Sphagnurus paluster TaxID=117069 RepID=A0A9P7K7W0_9AGAR|nr:hypothetical protein H0H81_004517 [Sphagnurus paluster]
MNPRKRPAAEPLLPVHSAKQRRTRMVGYDGGNPSPTEEAGLLSRWKKFGKDLVLLTSDTVKIVFNRVTRAEDSIGYTSTQSLADERDRPAASVNLDNTRSPNLNASYEHSRKKKRIKVLEETDTPSRIPYPPSTPPNQLTEQPVVSGGTSGPLSRPDSGGSSSTIYSRSGNTQLDPAPPPRRKQENIVIPRRYQNREHIFSKEHKANVRAETKNSKREMQMQLFQMKRQTGYSSTFSDFQSLLKYQAELEKIEQRDALSPSSSMVDLRTKQIESSPRRHSYSDNDMDFLRRAIDRARATLSGPRPPPPFQPSIELLRLNNRLKDESIEQLLRPKLPPPTPLPAPEDAQVNVILKKKGVVAKCAREQVSDSDMMRLLPCQWLNDEIINFYGALIQGRSDKGNPGGKRAKGSKSLNVHYFSTFFWPKLQEGYEKGRLAKWTKKIDLFAKDVVLIPVNHSNAHWTSAAINFRRKRIESYDSMGIKRSIVFKALRAYLDAEHRTKKNKPFDFTGWEDHSIEEPQQENGYDCGVFTCQFLVGLSRGDDYVRFTQKDMPHLRRRMIWEIGHATLREDP